MRTPLFPLGEVILTERARAALEAAGERPEHYLARHASGDWGEQVSAGDQGVNDQAAATARPVLSAYRTALGDDLWVYTEWDRSLTRIFLAEEYDGGPL